MLRFGSLANFVGITKLTVHHYRAIYTASIDFSPYSIEIRQLKILITKIPKFATNNIICANRQIFDLPIIPLMCIWYIYVPCCHDESLVVKVVLITRAYWSTRESCYSGLQLGIALIAIRVLLAFFLFLNCMKSLHRLFSYKVVQILAIVL